jgi:hypothetical protein
METVQDISPPWHFTQWELLGILLRYHAACTMLITGGYENACSRLLGAVTEACCFLTYCHNNPVLPWMSGATVPRQLRCTVVAPSKIRISDVLFSSFVNCGVRLHVYAVPDLCTHGNVGWLAHQEMNIAAGSTVMISKTYFSVLNTIVMRVTHVCILEEGRLISSIFFNFS